MSLRQRGVVAGAVLGCVLAASESSALGLKPSCLDELAVHAQVWAECTGKFSRQDSRCKKPAATMHDDLRRCRSKGHSSAEIDAAVLQGFRKAGKRP